MTLLSSFDDLLQAARQQAQPQRLLFVFAGSALPADADAAQRARFEAGQGGELAPLMSVDKTPDELAGFAALAEESDQFGQAWVIVFVAALSGNETDPKRISALAAQYSELEQKLQIHYDEWASLVG